ncbi:MAG: hypothetical protein JXB47_13760 [Anaerolineae bacterium]|nr:hypothetical protein [Anaerolineae bacterium]
MLPKSDIRRHERKKAIHIIDGGLRCRRPRPRQRVEGVVGVGEFDVDA